ncbi:MAG: hypothetical protein ACI9K2_003311 [Myxococcota bacterium]
MGVALLITLAAHAACPDRLEILDAATSAVVGADLFAARNRLNELEEAFACGGLAGRDELALLWLLEGALATFSGDADGAEDGFRAAAAISPGRFIEDLGPRLREQYEASLHRVAGAGGTVVIEPTLAGWTLAVDGEPVASPAEVAEGLHLVQVGPSPDEIGFARVIAVFGGTLVVDTGFEPILYRDPPTVVEQRRDPVLPTPPPTLGSPPAPPTLGWTVSAGFGLAMGRQIDAGAVGMEPAVKPAVPFETAVRLRAGSGWARAGVGTGVLLSGDYLYAQDDRVVGSPVSLGAHLAGGWAGPSADVGGLVGLQWPGRITARAVGVMPVGDLPLEAEARAGLNIATERPVEPAIELMLTFATDRL